MSDWAGKVAVVGVGTTAYGSFPDTNALGLGAQALRAALVDSGLKKEDLDGLLICRIGGDDTTTGALGLEPTFTLALPGAGRSISNGIATAAAALYSGSAKYVALVYGNDGRSRRVFYGGGTGSFESSWGWTSPGAWYAMMFQRYMAMYGATTAELAEVSIAYRQNAMMNPNAVMRRPLTVEEHENARFICAPLRLLDYCLINDGGVALIMTTAERARDLRQPPVYVKGMGRAGAFAYSSFVSPDFFYEGIKEATAAAYQDANVSLGDVDAFMFYDHFSPSTLFILEGMGACPRGEATKFIADGKLRHGGAMPTNTHGGHLSESYMQGWAAQAEAVRQVRGECGERQVKGCEITQYVAAAWQCNSIIYGSS